MRFPARFLILSLSAKKLYQLDFDGVSWSEFAVQPPFGSGAPGGLLCGTPDGRIAVENGATSMLHWDPGTNSWETIAHPGFASAMHVAKAVGASGDMIAVGSASGSYVFQYVASTKTWTKIWGPGAVNSAHGTSLTDVWMVSSVSSTGYVYHSTGGGIWSADLWPQIVADIGFWPHTPQQVFAVSPTEVYITTYPGSLSYGYEQYAQILKFNGVRWSAINPVDILPTPNGDGVPDCAGWNASSSAIHNGLFVDASGQVFTSGNFITINTNYIKQFVLPGGRTYSGWGSGGWVNLGTFTQGAGSCYAPIIAAGGSLLVYGTYSAVILRMLRSAVWTDVTTGFVGSSGSQPSILYGPDHPEIVNESPPNGWEQVNPRAWIEFDAYEKDTAPLNHAAATISVNGVPAWAADAALAGFVGLRAATGDGLFHYTIYRTAGFGDGESVTVAAHIEDDLGNSDDSTWTFEARDEIPDCAYGGGQYGDLEPPFGLCLDPLLPEVSIDGIDPDLVEELGGTEILVTGSFPRLEPLRAYLGPAGDSTDAPCYGGRGFGYAPTSLDGLTLRVISPPNIVGTMQLTVASDSASASIPITVVDRYHRGKQLSIRAGFPPWCFVGSRRLEED